MHNEGKHKPFYYTDVKNLKTVLISTLNVI